MGEFGDKFRKTREKREFSLDDVSHVTKIGVRMLRAIEEEHFDQLPGGIFNKGFIRAYAKHLGLNDEDAITDYLACLRQGQIDAGEVREPQVAAPAKDSSPVKPGKIEVKKSEAKKSDNNPSAAKSAATPVEELPELQLPRVEDVHPRQRNFSGDSGRGMPRGIVGIAAVVLVLALLFWMRRYHGPNTAAASESAAKAVSAKLELAKLEPNKREPTVPAKSETAKPGPITTTPASVAVAMPKPTSQPTSASGTVTAPAATSVPSSQSKATAPLTLVIRATETSWVSVLADGQPVSHETLIAPARTSVHATREIVARVGNAAGVTFLWNGQEVPADGAESEVKTFVFDSTGMRVVPSTSAAAQSR